MIMAGDTHIHGGPEQLVAQRRPVVFTLLYLYRTKIAEETGQGKQHHGNTVTPSTTWREPSYPCPERSCSKNPTSQLILIAALAQLSGNLVLHEIKPHHQSLFGVPRLLMP
jgi:hypothetical protein